MGSIGPLELVLIFVAILIGPIAFVVSLVWAYRDAERRGSNGVLVCVLVAVAAWPLSLIVWLLIRSDERI